MRSRASRYSLRTAAGIIAAVAALSAQSGRDAYRDAFKTWRQADPNLELDAATSPDLSQRTGPAAAAAARYAVARAAYLRNSGAQASQSLQGLNTRLNPDADLAPAVDMQKLVAQFTSQVSMQISTYADEADPALQPVRQALTKERAALVALSGAISDRQKTVTNATGALLAVEQARERTAEPFQAMAGALQGAASGMDQEAMAWTEYYRLLAAGAAPPVAPATANPTEGEARSGNTPLVIGGVRINNPSPNLAKGAASEPAAAGEPRANNPSGAIAPRINNPATLPVNTPSGSRFLGSWTYPPGGLYHGPQPDTADFEVNQEGGKLTGTLDVNFWPFGDITSKTSLHLEFSGTPGTKRAQSFPLVTSEGVKGSIDLIPGPAFNLLEINFYTERSPGKMTQGNLMLLRK